MKTLTLDFAQRIGLMTFLGVQEGSLAKLNALGRVYDLVRLSDAEMRQVKVTDLGNGTSTLAPPSPDFGRIEAHIEDADAAIVVSALDAAHGLRMADRAWANAVKQQLTKRTE
jgi:hypothetical protein